MWMCIVHVVDVAGLADAVWTPLRLCPHSLARAYHLSNKFRKYSKVARGRGLVKISAI